MKRRPRILYSESQKALMWERWKKGESLQQIAQLFDRNHSSVWHQQSGPLPAPLTQVPIRQGLEGPLVILADIPTHPRAHFARCLHLDDSETVVPASLWLYFIGEIQGEAP